MQENKVWRTGEAGENNTIFQFSEGYKDFLSENKVERECVCSIESIALENGFRQLGACEKLLPGDRVYAMNMHKDIILAVIGKAPFTEGVALAASHMDSPRLDIKTTPLAERDGICYFDSHYYGGIKPYHYMARPLALHGVVCKKDGSSVVVKLGEADSEPYFCITDIAPHFQKKEKEKEGCYPTKFTDEQLDVVVGNLPAADGKVQTKVLDALHAMGIEQADLISAELNFVPKGKACDLGFDRSLIVGYGQDDKSSVYMTLQALLTCKQPPRTAVCVFVDKEETGNKGATGTDSMFMKAFFAQLLEKQQPYRETDFVQGLLQSDLLSVDVTAAFDPNWPELENKATEAILSAGFSFSKYGSGGNGKSETNDANAEFIARLRNLLDANHITYQFTEMGRLDVVSGGTISMVLAELGGNVIDCGVPLLCMHAPCEIISKYDLWQGYRFFEAFFNQIM